MVRKLELLFADWPFSGEKVPSIPTNTTPTAPGVYIVDKDVNQGRVSMILPGIQRDNPEVLRRHHHERHPWWWWIHGPHNESRPLR